MCTKRRHREDDLIIALHAEWASHSHEPPQPDQATTRQTPISASPRSRAKARQAIEQREHCVQRAWCAVVPCIVTVLDHMEQLIAVLAGPAGKSNLARLCLLYE
jgi:hypothetical protein